MIDFSAVLIYIILINTIAFLLMIYDKYLAINHRWRISENALIAPAIILGAFGSYLGMKSVRHKTQKPKFFIGIPLLMVENVLILYLLIKYNIVFFN